MKTVQQICVSALLLALTGLAAAGIALMRTATAVVSALPAQIAATREALLGEARETRRDLLSRGERQAAGLRRDAREEADQLREAADRRLGDTLARVDAALETAGQIRRDLTPLLLEAEGTLRHTDRTVADLHPQLLGLIAASKVTAGETAQTMREVRGAVPGFLAEGQAIAGNVQAASLGFSGVADNLNRLTKPKWYDRLIGYGLNGAVIYRNLNPAASVTVKGAEYLSSRP